MKIMKFLEFHSRILKIMQIQIFHIRIAQQIMKFIDFHTRIKKTKHENLIIPRQNHENHEIRRIPCQNHENHEKIIIALQKN